MRLTVNTLEQMLSQAQEGIIVAEPKIPDQLINYRNQISKLETDADKLYTEIEKIENDSERNGGVEFPIPSDSLTYNSKINELNRRDEELNQLEQDESELRRQHKEAISKWEESKITFENQIRYIERTIALNDITPKVKKNNSISGARSFYSLWMRDSTVYLLEDGVLKYLETTNRQNPLEIKTRPIQSDSQNHKTASELKLLQEGMFYDAGYKPLFGMNEEIAANIFQQVLMGKQILPRPDTVQGFVERISRRKSEDEEPVYRHWGQMHLSTLSPDRVVDGQLLGSGGSYKAFIYQDRTVVEFDQPDHATYLFDTQAFENLSLWNRSQILEQNPKGFEGRVIHHDDQDSWKGVVGDFISLSTNIR